MSNEQPTRREAIADAAIEVLAEHGSRGLTHRAVDAKAGIAAGSTSYYFRTRLALLEAAQARVAQRQLALMTAFAAAEPKSALELAQLITGNMHAIRADPTLTIAMMELTLEAVRRPELRPGVAEARNLFVDWQDRMLRAIGGPDPSPDLTQLLASLGTGMVVELLSLGDAAPAAFFDAEAQARNFHRLLGNY
ncbi:TetR/AcrR family transcriptional regulator [Crossiella cryophila]|uniref:DNA-binding transcriptional regulator YbjK n=1 Tax=Crossiella cryophila TaxID=43355 RepID=A0A7W7CJT1_9PSEU|nr:TetR/AcrR family transcriptional regulator [Crossiella cryophila]MBB4682498.1 DNA-binding transcriptional regulator YbjK [Crossiella cryophila]